MVLEVTVLVISVTVMVLKSDGYDVHIGVVAQGSEGRCVSVITT
jgi:hypothetical protein